MIKKILILQLIIVSLFIESCSKKTEQIYSTSNVISISESNIAPSELSEPTQTWHQTDECICVLFGYGYNEKNFVETMTKRLYQRFGDYNNGGHILALTFPDDFKKGSKTYITNLESELDEKNVKGIILLGAPENTYKAIARMQDKYDGNLPYPVFSFFSQDDVVAMEDSSDFVLDKAQKAEINGILPEEEQTYVQEIPSILIKAVKYALLSESAFEKNAKLMDFVKMITGNIHIERYNDPETNLTSINHFVIE